ncbi:MAG: AAA family ATPase [Candidatus Hydrothermae bacterium]|nr:AAA family ATPase [Candidatus Hydrothermae bacterium]
MEDKPYMPAEERLRERATDPRSGGSDLLLAQVENLQDMEQALWLEPILLEAKDDLVVQQNFSLGFPRQGLSRRGMMEFFRAKMVEWFRPLGSLALRKEWKGVYRGMQQWRWSPHGVDVRLDIYLAFMLPLYDDHRIKKSRMDVYISASTPEGHPFARQVMEVLKRELPLLRGNYADLVFLYRGWNHALEILRIPMEIPVLDWTLLNLSYPFLGDVRAWFEHYMDTPAPLWFLYGIPGMGKSRFMGALTAYVMNLDMDMEIAQTLPSILEEQLTEVLSFVHYQNHILFLMDDAEFLLGTRHKALKSTLNDLLYLTGMGIPVDRVKLVFAYNRVVEPDPALLRAGRLFRETHFRPLTREEALRLGAYILREAPGEQMDRFRKTVRDQQTLAEVWAWVRAEDHTFGHVWRKPGFGPNVDRR